MAASPRDDDFEDYDKPGAERSRRRRGEDDDLDSEFDGDLLDEDWLTAKKNPSEVSDEELNDDLLQSDDEDQNIGQGVSLNATLGEFDQQVNPVDYTDDLGDVERGYQQEGGEYVDEYSQPNDMEMPDGQMEYSGEQAEGDGIYQDEVLDIQINEPLDDEFQVDDYSASYRDGEQPEHLGEQAEQQEAPEGEEGEDSQLAEEAENEPEPEEEVKEEEDEDEEEDDDGQSGRLRFKTERKDVTSGIVRLADAANKRRNIPETLELSEEAKADLMEFEEKERQRKQGRFGGRGGRGGERGGFRGRGGRGGFPGFGMGDFGGGRGRMNDQRLPMMPLHMGMQQSPARMPPPHHQTHHQQHHRQGGPGGPRGPLFQEHSGGSLAQQPLQPLIPQHMAHRSSPSSHGAPVRPQMDPPPRMMSPPPSHNHPHQQQQQQQPKNIHINPHFRGPASSPAQVPLMPPAQSQPRPAASPQRFPGSGDFQQQHMPGNFGQRPPHHMEPWRNQPPPTPQDREPFFIGDPGRFPGQQQHMFEHQNPGLLINSNNHQIPSQGHMAFNQPGLGGFNQPGQGPGGQLGLFQREPPRPNLPPQGHPQGHQGMASLTGLGGPPNTRPFMGHIQPGFQQQQVPPGPFPLQQLQFGMQVRMRGLMQHGPPHSHLQHHDLPLSHQQQQQQHHRQDLSQPPPHHHPQHQLHPNEQRQGPMMHHGGGQGQPLFHQMQQHGSPRQTHPGGPHQPQRNAPIRPRMNPPALKVLPQRNSNLRELPVAPGNQNMNNVRPASVPNVRPVARAMQAGVRPSLNAWPVTGSGRGRAQPTAANKAAAQLPGPPERTVVRRDSTGTQPNIAVQDPDEDEETRQYRLKIEEQKRLREEILKRKEMRRQMQAGVRKKELLERINGQGDPPQQQQQRQFPPKPQQPQQGSTAFPPNCTPPTPPALRQNVKTRLQMTKGPGQQAPALGWQGGQQGQYTGPGSNPTQQAQQQHQQQRRNVTQLNPIRPGGPTALGNMPMQGALMAGLGPGQAQALGPKSGVKRTVMQRANSGDRAGPHIPQKVRVVKLLGGGGDVSGISAPIQQQATRPAPHLRQGPVRKITLANPPGGQPIQGLVTQGDRGGLGNRVVVPGRGRARGAAVAGGAGQLGCGRGRARGAAVAGGAGQLGCGRLMPTRQNQRGAGTGDSQACTVSIDGLSTSTTDTQLQNLLNSIGPIQMFKMLPHQRKAIAKFHNPQHALSFQVSFNRHMIDLSHIDVSLIDG
ncbi:RNA-binding protein 33-like isoform X1 [Oncorhynchus masou masou]|uniref:RNA-binding protein 33-like isoform X1 n=1 Tax=Oncorhynchus masou masou TaxID=90313 RepID=UPI003183E9FD